MKSAKLLTKLVEEEDLSDFEAIQLIKGVYDIDDNNLESDEAGKLYKALFVQLVRLDPQIKLGSNFEDFIYSDEIAKMLRATTQEETDNYTDDEPLRGRCIINACRILLWNAGL